MPMGGRYSFKTFINYAIFGILIIFCYKYFYGDENQKQSDPFRSVSKAHPKNIQHKPVKDKGDSSQKTENDDGVPQTKMDVGDLPKDLAGDEDAAKSLHQKEKELLQVNKQLANTSVAEKKPEQKVEESEVELDREFHLNMGDINWKLEEEMKKRRTEFFRQIDTNEAELEPEEFMNLIEYHDDITFVTAGSHSTYYATIQFIYSVQYFYPNNKIAIYDIGLTSDEKQFIKSLCNTELTSLFLNLWPENLYKIRQRVWRPLLLQFAAVKFGHCVYVEPGRFIFRQLIKDYLEHSKVHGLVVGGKQLQYSPFFVTNPFMYTFLATDEKRLMKTPHVEFSFIILHNTVRVQQFFMRYLMACTKEEYCISPPGSQPTCDKYVGVKKYGHCHKYDESAINLILNRWHKYSPKEYFMKDLMTKNYEGMDMSDKVKVCNNNKKEEV